MRVNVAYTVDGTGVDKYTVYPENGSTVSQLDSIVITYPEESIVNLADENAYVSIYKDGTYLFYINNNTYGETYYDFVSGPEANQQTIKFTHVEYSADYSSSYLIDSITDNGVYTFTLAAGTYAFGEDQDRDNTKINFTYTVDNSLAGISEVTSADNADAPAYNIAGQRVNANTKGIVIKNGKKYLVK